MKTNKSNFLDLVKKYEWKVDNIREEKKIDLIKLFVNKITVFKWWKLRIVLKIEAENNDVFVVDNVSICKIYFIITRFQSSNQVVICSTFQIILFSIVFWNKIFFKVLTIKSKNSFQIKLFILLLVILKHLLFGV